MSSRNGLPKGWDRAKLRDLVQPRSERVSPQDAGDLPYIGMDNVEAHSTKLLGTVPASTMKSASARFYPQDALYGRLRPYLNKVVHVDFEGLASAEFIVLPDSPHLRSSYLRYRLNATDFVNFASHLNEGDRPRVNFDQIGAFEIEVPPPSEQERIVAKVEELFSDLDAGVAALERARANLKRYRAAVLKAAVTGKLTERWRAEHPDVEPASALLQRILTERRQHWEQDQLAKYEAKGKNPPNGWKDKYKEPPEPDTSDLPELPYGWCWATVSQLADVQGGIQKQPKRRPKINFFPFLRVANVLRNRLDLSDVHNIELFGVELEKLRLVAGDVLIVEGNGSKSEIGRSAIWSGMIEDCVHQNHIIRARFLAGEPSYFNAYWNSPPGMRRTMEMAASTSGLYTLSVTKVCSLPIPLPPLAEQAALVGHLDEQISVLASAQAEVTQALRRAERLRQSILKRAFADKLVPQSPHDEPAADLLARIVDARSLNESNGRPKQSGRRSGGSKKRKAASRE